MYYYRILFLLVPYIIKDKTTLFYAKYGEGVKFKCLVSKYYTRSYKWLHNGQELKSDYKNLKIKSYKFLRIKKVKTKDAGWYTCSVRNDIGRREITYQLEVEGKSTKISVDKCERGCTMSFR